MKQQKIKSVMYKRAEMKEKKHIGRKTKSSTFHLLALISCSVCLYDNRPILYLFLNSAKRHEGTHGSD